MSSTPQTQSRHDYELYQAWEEWKAHSPTPTVPTATLMAQVVTRNRGNVKTMARALYKQLRKNGYSRREVVTLTTELISLLTNDLRNIRSKRAA